MLYNPTPNAPIAPMNYFTFRGLEIGNRAIEIMREKYPYEKFFFADLLDTTPDKSELTAFLEKEGLTKEGFEEYKSKRPEIMEKLEEELENDTELEKEIEEEFYH